MSEHYAIYVLAVLGMISLAAVIGAAIGWAVGYVVGWIESR